MKLQQAGSGTNMVFAAEIRHLGNLEVSHGGRPVGYAALVVGLGLERPVIRPWLTFDTHTRHTKVGGWNVVAARQAPEDTPLAHLDFALRYEPLDLAVLKAAFQALGRQDVERYVSETRTGVANRQAWYLYEWLTGQRLNLPDLTMGNYVPVLDPTVYRAPEGDLSRRHRVRGNLGGTPEFCPLIRKTENTDTMRLDGLRRQIREVASETPAAILRRAASSLLFGETLTTFAIEGIRPPRDKLERWATAILQAGRTPLIEAEIARLQRIVLTDGINEPLGYRIRQNFVGSFDRSYQAAPERVNPRPEDVRPLMKGWEDWLAQHSGHLDPVAAAAAASFAFVYVHPLMDGNGRLHRYMLHHILAERGLTPTGLVFPVSIPMVEKAEEYKAVLHAFDSRVMPVTRWEHDGQGGVRVLNDVSDLYRFPEMSDEVSFVYDCISKAAFDLFPAETRQIANADHAMEAMSQVVDMSEERMRNFLMFVRQNGGKLAKKRAKGEFKDLSSETIQQLEGIIDRVFGDQPASPKPSTM
jgi:hypothetical protein